MNEVDGLSGKFVRLIGFFIDAYVLELLLVFIVSLLGLFFQLDKYYPVLLMPSLIITFVFFLLHEGLFQNSFGKYTLSIKPIFGDEQRSITVIQSVKRNLTKAIWPIDGIILLFSKKKKRLGDIWAHTSIVKEKKQKR